MFSWTIIKKIRKFSGFKLSAFIFFVYPLLVKSSLLVNVLYKEVIVIPLAMLTLNDITIPLPFSLTILYIGSIFLFFGNILYVMFCPDPINNYNNYKEFHDAKMSNNYLVTIFSSYVKNDDPDIAKLNRSSSSDSNETQKIFSSLYIKVNKYKQWKIITTLIFFSIGFISLLIISLQNIYTSISYILF